MIDTLQSQRSLRLAKNVQKRATFEKNIIVSHFRCEIQCCIAIDPTVEIVRANIRLSVLVVISLICVCH